MAFPRPKVIAPVKDHKYTIILLHGRGSNGEEFADEFLAGQCSNGKTLTQQNLQHCKWVFPQAHERISTVFQEEISEWFDIFSLSNTDEREELQLEGLRESIEHVQGIIEEEMKHVPAERIVLGGISQGLAVASHVLLSGNYKLGGFLGFSGWLPLRSHLRKVTESNATNPLKAMYTEVLGMPKATAFAGALDTPVFISHSADDPTIDIELGYEVRDILRGLGMEVDFYELQDGGHWIQEPKGYDAINTRLELLLRA